MASVLARSSIIAAGLLTATLLLPAAFGAEPRFDGNESAPVAFDFRFRQANLQTETGAHKVYRKLVYQATKACTDVNDSGLSVHRTDNKCATALVERVVRQVGSNALARQWHSAQDPVSGTAVAQLAR